MHLPKILYISPFLDGTGYGQASIDYILALNTAGIDVIPRPYKMNERRHTPPARIMELMKKGSSGCDVVIQHCLPHQMEYSGHFKKCIGLFAWETSNFRTSTWAERLNSMSEVWAINRSQERACRDSGVKVPIKVVPHATDITRFQRSYDTLDALKVYKQEGEFLFYTVGEFVRRKNLAALLRAFNAEFSDSEPVRLVIKTNAPGMSPEECLKGVQKFCQEIRRGMKLTGGREEVILTERLTDEGILRLHATCDVFVQPSYGEAWGIPAFDAMAMGKTPIVTAAFGYLDWCNPHVGWLVDCRLEPVFGVTESFQDLYTGKEEWALVDVLALRRAMRQAYEDKRLREEKSVEGIERAYLFSHEAVGALMKGLLAGEASNEKAVDIVATAP